MLNVCRTKTRKGRAVIDKMNPDAHEFYALLVLLFWATSEHFSPIRFDTLHRHFLACSLLQSWPINRFLLASLLDSSYSVDPQTVSYPQSASALEKNCPACFFLENPLLICSAHQRCVSSLYENMTIFYANNNIQTARESVTRSQESATITRCWSPGSYICTIGEGTCVICYAYAARMVSWVLNNGLHYYSVHSETLHLVEYATRLGELFSSLPMFEVRLVFIKKK